MSLAVGGDYEVMGEALRQRLVRFGLRPNDYLVDVGCGSGRVAFALARSHFRDTIRYLGVDIVPEMLDFAAEKCQQPRWRFELVTSRGFRRAMRRRDGLFLFRLHPSHAGGIVSLLARGAARPEARWSHRRFLSRHRGAGALVDFRGQRPLGPTQAGKTNGYFSLGRVLRNLGGETGSGDSRCPRARLRPAHLRFAETLGRELEIGCRTEASLISRHALAGPTSVAHHRRDLFLLDRDGSPSAFRARPAVCLRGLVGRTTI